MPSKKKEITITVELDDNDIPTDIEWNASDLEGQDIASCRALMLALWDHQKKDTLRLDLWTREMTIQEMKGFFYQTLDTMTDTFENATEEHQMAEDMRDFTAYFADKMGLTN